jgi:F-type H+-transporting ATPase subunit delta
MSATATLARPYAKAVFELAQKANQLASFSTKLATCAALSANAEVAKLLSSPRLQAAQRVALLLPQGDTADSAYGQFLSAMAENQRLSLLPEVAAQFEALRADAEKTLTVKVRTALAIEAAQQQQLIEKLSKRFNRTVSLQVVLEPDLIGGAVLDTGSIVIDGSLSGKLSRMHQELAA